jgi:hypothetical protein
MKSLTPLSISLRSLRTVCLSLAFLIVMIGQSVTWHNTLLDSHAHGFHDCEHYNACESSATNSIRSATKIEPIPFLKIYSSTTVYLYIAIAYLVRGPPSVSLNIH